MSAPANNVNLKDCPHCKATAPRFFKDDGRVACFICHKTIYHSFKKYCPTCKTMRHYHDSSVLHGSTCTTCGDLTTGLPQSQVILDEHGNEMVSEDWGNEEEPADLETVYMIPAREVYRLHRGADTFFISALYDEYKFQWLNTENADMKRQAWQYMKACVKLLKEGDMWFSWKDFEPGTSAWKTWWKENPEDQDDMAAFTRHRNDKAAQLTQVMLDNGESPEDVKEAIQSGLY